MPKFERERGPVPDRRRFMRIALGAVSMGTIGTRVLFAAESPITVVELRQYTLRGGQRDQLINLFEHQFIEPQEVVGAQILGTFRDAEDADRFVWMRGFRDMSQRHAALEEFYGGQVWQANKAAANATIIDSDNVMLLRPLAGSGGSECRSNDDPANRQISVRQIFEIRAAMHVARLRCSGFQQAGQRPALTNRKLR